MRRVVEADRQILLYGTVEPPEILRSVQLGRLSFLYSSEAIRRICWDGIELVRAVAWPIRDENWGTYAPEIHDETINENGESFSGQLRFSVAEGRLSCVLKLQANAAGDLHFDLAMSPSGGPFATNRAGFTVLHPITGIAGAPLQVVRTGGAVEQTAFPRLISPGQPVMDIQGLSYGHQGTSVNIEFHGETFEMEDQRNWSDASYKTYCVPLVFPFTYRIEEPTRQSIRLSLSGRNAAGDTGNRQAAVSWHGSDEIAPGIGLAVEPDWLSRDEVVAESGVGHLSVRLGPDLRAGELHPIASAAKGLDLDVELVVASGTDPKVALDRARSDLSDAGLDPARIIAFPEGYLASHQPSGPWPDGPTPGDATEAARRAFPDVRIGGGMLTNFTEFNRCPPDPAQCDFVTHGSTAIVHASDDLSVTETLEALPQIFESARALAGWRAYRLGLVSIGMRSNPYGAAVAANPAQVRRTMARTDPRQRGLFAAAWTVGVLAATQGQGIEAICPAAPSGPFGIAHARQPWSQPYFDELPEAGYFPIFHVVRAAAAMAGQRRLHVSGLPAGIHAYGVDLSTGPRVLIANMTSGRVTVPMAQSVRAVVLDTQSFADAAVRADWAATAPAREGTRLLLEGYATAFAEVCRTDNAGDGSQGGKP